MAKQIDDKAYSGGYKSFSKGKRLRDMVQPMIDAENAPLEEPSTYESREAQTNRQMSALIGFADAFLDHIRGTKR